MTGLKNHSCIPVLKVLFSALLVLGTAPMLFAAGGPISDEFNNATLNTSLWTVVNPVGNGAVSFNGTEAQLG